MRFKKTIILCSAFLLLLALWAWFTRPISASDGLKDRKLVQVSVAYYTITPGATGGDSLDAIYTHDPSKMQKVVSLMDQFPCNKKLLNRSPNDPSHFVVAHMMQVGLYYQTKDKKDAILNYLIESDGYIMIADWGQQFHDYGAGRFGSKKGKEYYQKMMALFDQGKSDPSWEK